MDNKLYKSKFLAAFKILICTAAVLFAAAVCVDSVRTANAVYVVKAVFSACLVAVLCFSVVRLEALVETFKGFKSKIAAVYSVCFSAFLLSLYNPLWHTNLTEFKRIIGQGIRFNYDCDKLLAHFNLCFIVFGILFVLFYLVINHLKAVHISDDEQKAWRFLDDIIVISAVTCIFKAIVFFSNTNDFNNRIFYYSSYLCGEIIAGGIIYIVFDIKKRLSPETYYKLMLSGFSLGFVPVVFAGSIIPPVFFSFLLPAAFMLACIIFIDEKRHKICCPLTAICGLPLLTSMYSELIFILGSHKIFISAPRTVYIAVVVVYALISYIVFRILKKKNIKLSKNASYILLILGTAAFAAQVLPDTPVNIHVFETANSSILITDFLNFGKIPIVEHYGGHMLSGVLSGILYGLFNNDYLGAISSAYVQYRLAVWAVIFYLILRKIQSDNTAFWTVLLFPFFGFSPDYIVGGIICLSAAYFVSKNTYKRAALFWIISVLVTLDRLDIGASFVSAGIIVILAYAVVTKNKTCIKQFIATLVCTAAAGLSLWCILCLYKNINPIVRLREFIEISLSNQNWAYATIGDVSKTAFSYAYIITPMAVELTLILFLFSGKLKEKLCRLEWIIIIILGLAYFANFHRGIVRHSLVEGSTVIAIWTSSIFISLFISMYRKRSMLFLPIFSVLMLVNWGIMNTSTAPISILYDSAENKAISLNSYMQRPIDESNSLSRVKINDDFAAFAKPFTDVLDLVLKDDETFLDSLNVTALYSIMKKECPVYVSQSPLQLSGEFSQLCFIDEIENMKDRIPVAIMPSVNNNYYNLDGIPNSVRYYKVSEYIYKNYIPLCAYTDQFALWVIPERYDEMKQILEKAEFADMLNFDYNSFRPTEVVSLETLPYIWANYDKKEAANNKTVSNVSKDGSVFMLDTPSSELDKENGNYLLLTAESIGTGELDSVYADVILSRIDNGVTDDRYTYRIRLENDKNNYIIRISTDYSWYSENINAFRIESDNNIHIYEAKILEGD